MLIDLNRPSLIHKKMINTLKIILLFFEEMNDFNRKKASREEFKNEHTITVDAFVNKIKTQDPINYEIINDIELFSRNKIWLEHRINDFKSAIPDKKIRIKYLKAACDDINYDRKTDDENFFFKSFQMKLSDDVEVNKKSHKLIVDLFSEIYTKFFSQIEKNNESVSNKDLFIKEFFNENLNMLICPSCLGMLNYRNLQLDHFFPISQFPVLAIHPYNLVPICSTCNTSIGKEINQGKAAKIPTSPKDITKANVRGSLRNIYFPYTNSALKKIIAVISSSDDDKSIEKKMKPKLLDVETEDDTKIKNHTKLFNLEHNWSSKIPLIHNTLLIKAKNNFVNEIHRKIFKKDVYGLHNDNKEELMISDYINVSTVTEFLYYSYILDQDENVMRIPDSLLISSYAMWLLKTTESMEAFVEELKKSVEEKEFTQERPKPFFFRDNIY